MTQANEPNDRNREIDRQLRSLSRRVDRLEYSQISPQEYTRAFNRVYDEIEALEEQIDRRFDRLESEVSEIKASIGELNRKFDIVMNHITGQGNQ